MAQLTQPPPLWAAEKNSLQQLTTKKEKQLLKELALALFLEPREAAGQTFFSGWSGVLGL